ncbi:hypothetical protein JOC76_002454 [Neobacillus cucumis]|nr:hypothetical protein [Neobacillus cucumis]
MLQKVQIKEFGGYVLFAYMHGIYPLKTEIKVAVVL